MEWLIGSVLILIASTSTIAALAISAVIILVLAQALTILYRGFARPHEMMLNHSGDNLRQS